MSKFHSHIMSDELAACDDYQEWQDLREAEAIAQMEREQEAADAAAAAECWDAEEEEEDCCCFCGIGLTDSELHRGYCSQCD